MKCSDYENIVEFGNKVNANCEKAQMNIGIENLKILIFISKPNSVDSSVFQLIMKFVDGKMNKNQSVTYVIEEVRSHLAMKNKTQIFGLEKLLEMKSEAIDRRK
jgi:hypothetical protein